MMFRNPVTAAIGLILAIALLLVASLAYRGGAAPTPAEASPRERETVLRFGHNTPEDSALHLAAVRFAEELARRSAGRVRVEVFPAQRLGTDEQMLEMARQGELDILLTPTAKLSAAVPAMQYADLPFYFPAREDLYDMLDGEPGRMLLEKLRDIDLVGVTFWENGFKHFTGNRPLRRPEDFVGMEVRIMKSRMLMEQFRAFGAHSIPIDFHATRKALADGVVDGQENPLIAIVGMGLHEVQGHLTLSSHGYLGYVFIVSGRAFESLPPDLRQLLVDTARELTPWERAETHRRERALLQTIRNAGVAVHELDADERRRFAAATAHIPARFEEAIGAHLLSRTEELLDAKYAAGRGERILIGVDADLSLDCRDGGLAIKRGAALAIDEINAAGGVLGKPLQLLARDHRGLPSQGLNDLADFAARPDLVAVLGGVHSSVVVPQVAFAQNAGLPFLLPWSTAAEAVGDYVFRASANDRAAAPFMIGHLLRSERKIAVLLENSVWGRGNLEAMRARLKQEGLDFVHVESFNRGETDFAPALTRIARSGAEAVVMVAAAHEGGLIVRALAARALPLRVISHWGISCGDFWAANREALARVNLSFFQTFTFAGNPRPAGRALGERYGLRYGLDSPGQILAPQGVAQAYDLVHLLAKAIAKAGSTDRRAVRDALERLPAHEGAVKRYVRAFAPATHEALFVEDYQMARYADDGAIVVSER